VDGGKSKPLGRRISTFELAALLGVVQVTRIFGRLRTVVSRDQIQFRINPMLTLRTTIAMRKMSSSIHASRAPITAPATPVSFEPGPNAGRSIKRDDPHAESLTATA
jgi:hypothetical protein